MINGKTVLNISDDKLTALCDAVRKGLSLRVACEKAGIPFFYVTRWLNLYDNFMKELENNPDTDVTVELKEFESKEIDRNGKKCYLYTPISMIKKLKMKKAEWIEEKQDILNNSDKNISYQSTMWLLERRAREDYGTEPTETTNREVESIKVVYVDSSTDKDRLERLTQEVAENIEGKR